MAQMTALRRRMIRARRGWDSRPARRSINEQKQQLASCQLDAERTYPIAAGEANRNGFDTGMKQLTLTAVGFERYAKTRRGGQRFLPRWSGLCRGRRCAR
jgi:hypothetical protein